MSTVWPKRVQVSSHKDVFQSNEIVIPQDVCRYIDEICAVHVHKESSEIKSIPLLQFEQNNDKLDVLEEKLRWKILSLQRLRVAVSSMSRADECTTLQTKYLRIFIRHEYDSIKKAFKLFVEGVVLDKLLFPSIKFGSFWEKIKVEITSKNYKKSVSDQDTLENSYESHVTQWSLSEKPNGIHANCFMFLLPAEKSIDVRIQLFREMDFHPRYELSPVLKHILPTLRVDPTEQEVFIGVWSYIQANKLYDKKLIRPNEDLKHLIGMEPLPIANLKTKIMEHLYPSKPISIDYHMGLAGSSIPNPNSGNNLASYGPLAMPKYSAKAFDIEVDVEDTMQYDLINYVNQHVQFTTKYEDLYFRKWLQLQYISNAINRLSNYIRDDEPMAHIHGIDELVLQHVDPIDAIRKRPHNALEMDFYEFNNLKVSDRRLRLLKEVDNELKYFTNQNSTFEDVRLKTEVDDDEKDRDDQLSYELQRPSKSPRRERKNFDDDIITYSHSSIHNLSGYIDLGNSKPFVDNQIKGTGN